MALGGSAKVLALLLLSSTTLLRAGAQLSKFPESTPEAEGMDPTFFARADADLQKVVDAGRCRRLSVVSQYHRMASVTTRPSQSRRGA